MKTKLQVTFIALMLSSATISQVVYSPQVEELMYQCTPQTLSVIERQLSGDTSCLIGGNPYIISSRHWTSPHNNMAGQFIYEQFQSYGLNAYYMNFNATGRNVYAVKTGIKYPNQKFIICSHYDDMPSGSLAPGSDDNASGTSAVMEAARILAPLQLDYTVVFIAFDEEERGLYGSHAYADSAFSRGDSIIFVFNYDMIAWDSNNDYYIDLITNTYSTSLSDNIRSLYNLYQPSLIVNLVVNNNNSISDHYFFWQRGYNAFCGIESLNDFNPNHHTVQDNYSNLNFAFFHTFTKAAIAAFATYGFDYVMNILHTPIPNTTSTEPQVAATVIQSPQPIAKLTNAPRLYYKINSGNYVYANAFYNNLDTFKFQIPGQPYGTSVSYYFAAQDSLGRFVGTLPQGGKGISPPGIIVPPTVFSYSVITGIANNHEPEKYSLEQNYPNPFNASTNIKFSLPKASYVKLVITNILGEAVGIPVEGKMTRGEHVAMFNANDLGSGTYFYSLFIEGSLAETKKMILVK